MGTEEIIKQLKSSGLFAECPCGGEFKLSEAILFDGTKSFPEKAVNIRKFLEEEFIERQEDLKNRIKNATTKTQKATLSTNIGQELEKICPTFNCFKWALPDCRFLGNPIDFLAFDGLSKNKIEKIDFVELKTGAGRLNPHQKSIKDAVEDGKVSFEEFT